MTTAIGLAIVLLAIGFALLPLFRKSRPTEQAPVDPATLRTGLYHQILDAELDTQLGKLQQADYEEMRARLLQDAAALITIAQGPGIGEADAEAWVEREIAAARAALRGNPSMQRLNA